MTGLATQTKNRLHVVLQRHHLLPPEGNPVHVAQQLHAGGIANQNEQVSRLLQLPGFGVVTTVMVWAAIGNVQRLADPQHLVSGLVSPCSEVLEVCLPTRKRKSLTRTICCSVRSPAPRCFESWAGTDRHCLRFEETHPTATLQKQSERRPKH